jgi:ABC-2 type transport system permease protein
MWNQIYAIVVKEIKTLMRDRGAVMGLFLLPIAFILVMTSALQGVFDSGTEDRPIVLTVVNQDQGHLAEEVLDELRMVSGLTLVEEADGADLTREKMEQLIVDEQYSLGMVFPTDFSARILDVSTASDGVEPAQVLFVADPTLSGQVLTPARGMVEGYVERVSGLARVQAQTELGLSEMAGQVPAEQSGLVQAIGQRLTGNISAESAESVVTYQVISPAAYHMEVRPSSVEQNVPAYTIYGVFFILQTIATSFFREKNNGTFQRLQAAPLSKTAYLIGKNLAYYLINLIQIALMFAVGVVVYHLNLGKDPLALVVISMVTAAAATGLGMMVTSFVKSLEQASSMGTLLGVVLSVIGGMMVPAYVMPDFMQIMSNFTPHAWALKAYQDIMVRGLDLSSALPSIGMLALFALGFWVIAIWRFRYE